VRLPDEIIEEIRASTDIVDLVGGFVSLRKAGKSWKGLCPFHTEKTPSFHVTPDRGIFHCFGCGRGGNVYAFLMEHEGLSFLEAVRFLADRAGIALPKPSADGTRGEDAVRETTLRATRAALDWFRKGLADRARGARAREYLAGRGIGADAIEAFAIGYAPPEWDGLLKHLARSGFAPEALERAGLIVRRERGGGFYDRFRDRIIFPIQGPTGQPIAFGGRILGEGEPKYLNSPETPIFRKGRGLFGLYANRGAIRDAGHAVLVEGYTDLIGLYSVGVRNTVAPLGTAFTEEQAKILSNHTRLVVLLYDADDAGRAAALRTIPSLLSAGIAVRVGALPEGADPDDFARREGSDAARAVVDGAPGWVHAVMEATSREGREAQARRIVELLGRVSDGLTLGILLREASAALGLSEDLLRRETEARRLQSPDAPARPIAVDGGAGARPAGADGAHRAERALLALCLREPLLVPLVAQHIGPDDFADAAHRRLAHALLGSPDREPLTELHALLARFREEPSIQGLVTEALGASEEEERKELKARDYVLRLLRRRMERTWERTREELRRAQERRDVEAERRLLKDLETQKQASQELVQSVRIPS
jgi:DNA primase